MSTAASVHRTRTVFSSISGMVCVERALSASADDASAHNDMIAVREEIDEKDTGRIAGGWSKRSWSE
jgi:hypothetical protein